MTFFVFFFGVFCGFGFVFARQLSKKGMHDFLTARNKDAGEEAAKKLRKENLSVDFILLDISDIESIKNAVHLLSKKVNHLDVLINNAAVLSKNDDDLLTVPEKVVQDTIHTNVFGTLFVVQHFANLLSNGSRIINI